MSVHVMEYFPAPEVEPVRREFRAALVGCGLTGAMVGVITPEASIDLIDFASVEPRQTILPPFTQPLDHKATAVLRHRCERFPWAAGERALLAPAEAVGDGYWRSLAGDGGLPLACTDSVATQTYLASMARRHGLPMIATGLGPDAIEVLVVPADRELPCYGCLGRDPGQPPVGCFLDGVDAIEANAPVALPTNSTLPLAAAAAAMAVEEAQALAAGTRQNTNMIHLTSGEPILRARMRRRFDCPVCAAGDSWADKRIISIPHTTEDTFEAILETVGVDGETAQAVLPGAGARGIFCPDCSVYTDLPHLLLGRRVRCGVCGSDAVLAAERLAPQTPVALADALTRAPVELGWPWWPIIQIRSGAEALLVELADDAATAGDVLTIGPVTVGEVHAQ